MSKNTKYILLIGTFLINAFQWIFIFSIPWGGFQMFSHFSFPFVAMINKPELSHLSDIVITIINSLIFLLYFGGIGCGIIIPVLYKIALKKRLLLNSFATFIPLLLLALLLIIFPSPDSFLHYPSNGFQWEKYEWHRKNGDYVKIWRSEKCDTCYQPHERIKWILIKKGYENKK